MEKRINLKRTPLLITGLLLITTLSLNAAGRLDRVNKDVQYELLQQYVTHYQQIENKGGWDKITLGKKHYQKGESSPVVIKIKERLRATGEYKSKDNSAMFTDELADAVKKVQRQYGFNPNGVVDAQLVKQLNIPVEKRINQLLVNMERLKELPAETGGTRLIANIPEFKLHVYEGNRHVFDMAIVVGTAGNKTVVFNDEMKHIVFSPYWNVPQSIVRNEILPAMRKNRNYLRNNGYIQSGTENGLPVIRQKPGAKNALGKVKFLFPNSYSIYFHDTPAKSLFNMRKRAFSHGCIRLAEPKKLAEYLLRNDPEWTSSRIQKAMDAGKETWVELKENVAVSITYFTAWVDAEGKLNFREDIYGHDKQMARSIAKG